MARVNSGNYQSYMKGANRQIDTHTREMYLSSSPTVQAGYGPYDSIETAHKVACYMFDLNDSATASTPCTSIQKGFTIAIENLDGSITEYQYKKQMPAGGYTAADLEVKSIANVDASDVSYGNKNVGTALLDIEENVYNLKGDVGIVSHLKTTYKQDLVGAINEVKDAIPTSMSAENVTYSSSGNHTSGSIAEAMYSAEQDIVSLDSDTHDLRSDVGNLSNLDTSAQNLVAAINSGITSASNSATAAAADADAAASSASTASGYYSDILTAMGSLGSGEAVAAQVAINQADIAGLKSNIVVDLSVRYNTSYANLSAALTALNSDTATDAAAIKKAGVSIKFINSTTNKYEQWNLKASSWSTNTSDWALDADGSITDGKLKLPFELEKPSANEYVTQASQIGHNGQSLDKTLEGLDNISKESTQSEEDAIIYETNEGMQVGKIDANGADFTNLKRGGQQVARMADLPTVPTLDTSIDSSPSNSHTPSTKAVKDYVDANIPEVPEYPIETESTSFDTEEVIFGNDAGTQQYAKVSSEGVRAVAYKDMQGNNVIPVKDASIGNNPSNTNVPTTKAVKDYVDAHSGDYPIEKETTQSDDEEQVWENDAETQEYAKIGSYGIKSKAYLDMQGDSIIDDEIGDTPSTTHAPSSKAMKDYVDEHGGGTGDLPISKEETQSDTEEVVYGNNEESEDYVKIGNYGIKAKAFLDLDGNPIGGDNYKIASSYRPMGLPTKTVGDTLKVLVFGNSFTMNIYTYLANFISNFGLSNVIYARTHDAGATLSEDQSSDYITMVNDHIISDAVFYNYVKRKDNTVLINSINEYTIDDILEDEDWDIIVLQNGSTDSANWKLIHPYLSIIIGYIRSKVGRDVCLGFNNTWSWGSHSTLYALYPLSGGSQSAMDGGIADVRKKIANEYGLIVAEEGSAIKLLRESVYNNAYVDNNTPYEMCESVSSGNSRHLEGAMPNWVAGMVFFNTFIAPVYNIDIANCTFNVSDSAVGLPVTNDNRAALIAIVKSVCNNKAYPAYPLPVDMSERVTVTGSIANEGTMTLHDAKVNITNDKLAGNYSTYIKSNKTFALKILPSTKKSIIRITTNLGSKTIEQVINSNTDLGSITL